MRVDKRIRFEYTLLGQGNFKSGEKMLQIQKYPDTCGQGLNLDFEIRGPQHSAMSMCTGHPVLHSAFAMGLTSLQAKINYYQ